MSNIVGSAAANMVCRSWSSYEMSCAWRLVVCSRRRRRRARLMRHQRMMCASRLVPFTRTYIRCFM
jgi:hypothetical protein